MYFSKDRVASKVDLLVLCTVDTGLDVVAQVLRQGHRIAAIVGVHPDVADPLQISGWVDVAVFALKWNIPYEYVTRYDLKSEDDKAKILNFGAQLVLVAGWQRLVPSWLIDGTKYGVLGGHGSPDGIHGGRGRSPQNWALILGCRRFDMALFRIAAGIDDGPIVAERSFIYNETDDISLSYKKAALCMGEMVCEVLENPVLLEMAKSQKQNEVYYFPQRKPEDGLIDWTLSSKEIWAYCRALTRPYPGLRSLEANSNVELIIWNCLPFDEKIDGKPGQVSFVFEDDSFLVNCGDGRILIEKYEWLSGGVEIRPGLIFKSRSQAETLAAVVERHIQKFPSYKISPRIWLKLKR